MACTAGGRMRKQGRGLIDLGCESETKLRRTHDKGKGAQGNSFHQPAKQFARLHGSVGPVQLSAPISTRLHALHGGYA